MGKTFTCHASKRIKEVHRLSSEYNGAGKEHMRVLVDLVSKHAEEIRELFEKQDEHLSVETGDLMVLCLEILEERKKDKDKIMEKCYDRYMKKLTFLNNERTEAP